MCPFSLSIFSLTDIILLFLNPDIVEDFGTYDPSTGGTAMGSLTSDGSTYVRAFSPCLFFFD